MSKDNDKSDFIITLPKNYEFQFIKLKKNTPDPNICTQLERVFNMYLTCYSSQIPQDIKKTLISMYIQIQGSIDRHTNKKICPSYLTYKLAELLKLDELIIKLTPKHHIHTIMMNDEVWEKVCNDLGWEFILTIQK
jgi:hypothetical protein